eukprot:86447-Amphidinium_carterae.1
MTSRTTPSLQLHRPRKTQFARVANERDMRSSSGFWTLSRLAARNSEDVRLVGVMLMMLVNSGQAIIAPRPVLFGRRPSMMATESATPMEEPVAGDLDVGVACHMHARNLTSSRH